MSNNLLLDASMMSDWLEKGPCYFYYRWLHNGTGIVLPPSKERYDHDLVFGSCWAKFTHRFYTSKDIPPEHIVLECLAYLTDNTNGWLSQQEQIKLSNTFQELASKYEQQFSRDDSLRKESELEFETKDGFCGRLDGLGEYEGLNPVIHECKATGRKKSLTKLIRQYLQSVQAKLYAVATKAEGVVIELALKDPPYEIYRHPLEPISEEQRRHWRHQLLQIKDNILHTCLPLGQEPDVNKFLCNPKMCSFVTKNYVSDCPYQALCDNGLQLDILAQYFPRQEHLQVRLNDRVNS